MAFIKLRALKDFGEKEKSIVSDEILEGQEFLVNDEQARRLVALASAERASDKPVSSVPHSDESDPAPNVNASYGVPRQENQ